MIVLKTSEGEALSKILREVSPIIYTSNRQTNKLLDGTYHVQIIGGPLRSIEASIVSTFNQAEKLNRLIDIGTPLLFLFMDKEYLVYVDESISWNRINFGHGNKDASLYEGKVTMVIKEEVVL